MICPKCGSSSTRVTHTYDAGDLAKTQRRVCTDCGTIMVTVSEVVCVNPGRGEGAHAEAERRKRASTVLVPAPEGEER